MVRVPRPPKCRRVAFLPQQTDFLPAGKWKRQPEEVVLSIEEIEALRLRDLEGLEQGEGALRMCISRSTFQRLLVSARTKVTDALINGKAIRIKGGNYYVVPLPYSCVDCGYEWEAVPDEEDLVCPRCSSRNAFCRDCRRKSGGRGWGRCGRGRCKERRS